jgi:methylglutaconyl-CoA hydratase
MTSHLIVKPGRVAELSLNRPDRRNALSDETLAQIARAFRDLAQAPSLRAVILKGEGRDFCAGADIDWMRRAGRLSGKAAEDDARLLASACLAVDECPVPVIARVHGNVYGGGLGLLAAADIAVAAEDARFCFSECRLGILPAVVSSFVLPKIGSHARRYYLTAELFGTAEAMRLGLVHETAPEGALDHRIEPLIKGVLSCGPNAVREAKSLLRAFPGKNLHERVDFSIKTLLRARSSSEGQEGLSAFLEKRKPAWTQ